MSVSIDRLLTEIKKRGGFCVLDTDENSCLVCIGTRTNHIGQKLVRQSLKEAVSDGIIWILKRTRAKKQMAAKKSNPTKKHSEHLPESLCLSCSNGHPYKCAWFRNNDRYGLYGTEYMVRTVDGLELISVQKCPRFEPEGNHGFC